MSSIHPMVDKVKQDFSNCLSRWSVSQAQQLRARSPPASWPTTAMSRNVRLPASSMREPRRRRISRYKIGGLGPILLKSIGQSGHALPGVLQTSICSAIAKAAVIHAGLRSPAWSLQHKFSAPENLEGSVSLGAEPSQRSWAIWVARLRLRRLTVACCFVA
jgi:hypothetical protein